MSSTIRISIEVAENGYEVEVPDFAEIKKKEAQAKKDKYPSPYIGDCTKTYVAKTPAEVLKYVKEAISNIPDVAYADAFDEAAKEMKSAG